MNNRLAYIDFVRAYAIFLVTSFHLWRFFERPNEILYGYNLFSIFEKGWGGVELFFVISGYSMALITFEKQKIDWQKYFIKRIVRIVPAYYIAIIIWDILIYHGIAPKPIGLIDQLTHIFFIHTFSPNTYYSLSGVFWSLGIEMQFYFLLPLLFWFIIRFPILTILFFSLPLLYNSFIVKSFLFEKTVFAFIIYFVLGYVLYIKRSTIYNSLFLNKMKISVLIICIIFFLHFTFYSKYIINEQIHIFLWVISFIPIFIYMSKSNYIEKTNNKILILFKFTGTASYSIYLYNYIFYIHIKPFDLSLNAIIFYFLLVYIIGISMYYLIERPFLRLRKNFIKQ